MRVISYYVLKLLEPSTNNLKIAMFFHSIYYNTPTHTNSLKVLYRVVFSSFPFTIVAKHQKINRQSVWLCIIMMIMSMVAAILFHTEELQ